MPINDLELVAATVASKPALQSKTVIGALIALIAVQAPVYLPGILSLFGFTDPAGQAEAVQAVVGLFGGAGALLALYGRLTAKKPLH
jgi:hypothetical protein